MSTYDYSNGKIYTIRSHQTNKYYIGSTRMNTLAQRLGKHRSNYKDYLKDNIRNNYISSFDLLMYNDHYIELLEDYPCSSKEQLFKREGELQRQFKSEIVNRIITGRTQLEYYNDNLEHFKAYRESHKDEYKAYCETHKEELKAYRKDYYDNHKEDIILHQKAYYELHKDHIIQQTKQYKATHKEFYADYHNQYYEQHKDIIKTRSKIIYEANKEAKEEIAKQPFTCQCGANIRTDNQRRHGKTAKHLNYIQQTITTPHQPITQSPATITEPEIYNLTII